MCGSSQGHFQSATPAAAPAAAGRVPQFGAGDKVRVVTQGGWDTPTIHFFNKGALGVVVAYEGLGHDGSERYEVSATHPEDADKTLGQRVEASDIELIG